MVSFEFNSKLKIKNSSLKKYDFHFLALLDALLIKIHADHAVGLDQREDRARLARQRPRVIFVAFFFQTDTDVIFASGLRCNVGLQNRPRRLLELAGGRGVLTAERAHERRGEELEDDERR